MPILVVDDSLSMVALLSGLIEDMGYEAQQAMTAESALAMAADELPELVMMDVNLPGMDGYEAAMRMKAAAGDHHLPIIFISGSPDADILAKCLAIGEDFIAKPFSQDVVSSKISARLRIAALHTQLRQQNTELKRHQHRIDAEHEIVETIFSNHFKRHITNANNLRYHISPKSVFNGDVLLTAMGPSGNLYVVVGDVTGHGLPAAVGAIPAYPTFRVMAEKGLGIGTIAAEMNRSLRGLLPDNMMLSAHLLELSSTGDSLTVWSGGMPPMVLEDGAGRIKQLITPKHCPLAMLEEIEFSQDVDVYQLARGDRIYLFTDGMEESRNSNGEMFGEGRLHGMFDGSETDMFGHIIDQLNTFIGDQEPDDDITLVEITCLPEADTIICVKTDGNQIPQGIMPWTLSVELTPTEMKSADPIPQIVKLLGNAWGLDVHQDYLSTILSEFYCNALEHGLLGLDSAMKEDPDGFMDYYQQRKERLAGLAEGHIRIDISFQQQGQGGLVHLKVADSGLGFDYVAQDSADHEDSFGRGVDIVRHLCGEVTYSEGGSTVAVTYPIGEAASN